MRIHFLMFISLFLWLMHPVSAQTYVLSAQALQGRNDSAVVLSRQMAQVEVVASHQKRELASSAPLQQLSQEEMLHVGITDVADALHRMAGITLRDYGGAGGLKTVSVRGFGGQHTGVSYDGVLLGECQGGEIDLSRYSLDNVASLRLTVGDNDDIFMPARQAASAAVLSIETLAEMPADRRPHLVSQLRVGSFGYVNPFARYVQQVTERLTLSLTGEYLYAENNYPFTLHNGTLTTRERRTNSRMNSGHAEVNLHGTPNLRNQWWLKAYYYDNDRQLPGIVRYYTNLSAERLRERNVFVQARWQMRSKNDRWLLKLNAKLNWASSAYQDTLVAQRRNDATYWQREQYLSGALLYLANRHLAIDYSADYLRHSLNSTLASDRHPYRNGFLQSLSARYTDARLTILARLLSSIYLNGVDRKNSMEEAGHAKNMRRISPSLSASYRLLEKEDIYLRLSYKNIFRVPTFSENYFFHYGSTDLEAEKTDQWNLGLTWGRWWTPAFNTQFSLDGYLNHVKDKIVGVPYNMFIWRTVNVGKVGIHGVDLNFKSAWRMSVGQSLELAGTWSWQRVANRTDRSSAHYGKQIAYMPQNSGSLALGWQNPWVNLSLHGQGTSGRWANNNHYEGTRIDGYWEMGMTAYRTFRFSRGKTLELRLDLKNLFDVQYEVVAHYPMPGRSWQGSVKVSF